MTREEFSTVQPGDRLVTATPEMLENIGTVVDAWDEEAKRCLGERIAVVTHITTGYDGLPRVQIDLDNGVYGWCCDEFICFADCNDCDCDEFEDSGAPIDIMM